MRRNKRILSLLLVGVLCFSIVTPAKADSISDAKAKQQKLEQQKKEAEAKKRNLTEKLNDVLGDMEKAENDLDDKKVEIMEAQDDLDQARIDESRQYEDMKMRIKYMYEHGNTEFIEILCNAKNISDFLNKAEYIKQLSEYDREMLVEFQSVVKQVEEKEAQLKKEEAKLMKLQDKLIDRQKEVKSMLAENDTNLADLEGQIGENSKKLKKLIALAEKEKEQQAAAQKPSGGGNSGGSSGGNSGGSSGGGSNGGGAGGSQIIGNGRLSWPTTSTRVTSYYGWRPVPVAGATSWHDAIDIGAPLGSPVFAADAGRVITASNGYNGGRGNYIMVDHGNGMVTRYQHLNAIYVSVGQKVSKGQNIAAVGNTGASSGPHLDFAVYVNGSTVDPMTFF